MTLQHFAAITIAFLAVADAQLVTYEQFSQAVSVHGYPPPSYDQYNVFVTSAGPEGLITDKQEAAMALTHFIHEFIQAPCSQDLFGDDRLVRDPDSVARSEEIAWDTAFWFWKVAVHTQPGVAEGKFGVTTNAINGGLECRGDYQHIAKIRFEMYKLVRSAFGLDPNTADERGCYN